MGVSFKSTREAVIDIFTLIGYSEKMIPYLYYFNISLQFIWFYILVILNGNSELNATLTSVRDGLTNLLTYPLSAPIINIVFLSLSLIFGIVCLLYKNQSEQIQSLSSNNSSAFKLSQLISKLHIFLNFLSIPCLIINFTCFDLSNKNQSLINNSLIVFIIAIINICLVAFSHLSYSERLLLGKWTFPLVLFTIGTEFIIIPLKIISILAIFIQSIKKPTFERILLRLLLFISIMDFICLITSYKIKMIHFIMFNVIIIISELMYPQQMNQLQVEQQNEILFHNLQQLSKNKKVDKKNQIILMSIVFKNKQRLQQNSSYFHSAKIKNIKDIFQTINVNSFQWLSNFIKLKFDLNIKETPHKTIIKLYRIIFSIHYETLTVNILHSLMTLNKDFQNFTFKDRIFMKQIQDLLNKKYLKKKEQVRNYEVVTINKNIEEFYKVFIQTIEIMPAYWYKFRFNSLTQQDMFELLVEEVQKENKITKYMEEIVKYKHSQTQIKIYDYVMKLLNFDYEPKIMTKGDIEFGKTDFGLSHYICLTQNKISDVSNRLLIELKRKKEELLGENVQILVPRQLKHFLQSKFENTLQTVKEPPEFIMPFIQMREFLLPYIIKIDLKFNYSSGLTYVIHFLKSLDLQQSPCFLYSLDNDQIVNSCPLFLEYLQLLKRKVNFNLLGIELFGFDLAQQIMVNKKTINDKIQCYLKRQKEKQQNLALVLIIKNIYESGNHRYVLFQIQRKNILIVSKQETIQNLVSNTQPQKDQVKNHKQNYKNQQFFCKIPNPYESLLSEKMNKLNMNCRKSNLKYISIIAIVVVSFLLAGIIFVNLQVQGQIKNFKNLYDLSSQTSTQKENIYLLPLILYQYFQIKNFPASLQKIQKYDFRKLQTTYYEKVNSQISTLSPYPFTNLIQKNNKYTLIYPNYQKTLQTSPSSILDFMTIAKKSLATNKMNFVIRNQEALDIIVKSYKQVSMDPFDDFKDDTKNIIYGFFGAFAFLTFLIKLFAIKTRLLAREFFSLYSKLSKKQIQNIIQKYEELLMAGKYALYSKNDYDCNKKALQYQNGFSLKSVSNQELQQINPSGKNIDDNVINIDEKEYKNSIQSGNKIKNTSNGKLILKYSNIFVIPLICCSYFFIYLLNIQQYQKAASLILQKNINLKNSIVTMTQKAQKFYQASMIEQIIVNPTNNWAASSTQNLTVNFDLQLPSEFADYMALQKKMINYDMCKNLEPNQDPLFEGVNCYDILNGVMSKGIIQTYALYSDIIQDYGGLLISRFGQVYRSNAKYPVFFEILYIRHSVCNILSKLQVRFNESSLTFVQNQNANMSSNLMKGLILLPILLGYTLILILNLHKESQAIIKSFRVLPRDFLLDIKITKFLKNQEILDKIQMIPF